MAGLFIAEVKLILPVWGKDFKLINERSKTVLGVEYRSAAESTIAMANSIIDSGLLEDKRKPK